MTQTPDTKIMYAAVQNGCILDLYDNRTDAESRVRDEIKRDWFSIMLKRKLRKLMQKSGDVALHRYSILSIFKVEEIK